MKATVAKNVIVTLDYSSRDYDDLSSELEFLSAGLVGNMPWPDNGDIQLFGALTWERIDVSSEVANAPGGGGDGGGDGGDGGGDIPTCAADEMPLIGGQCLPEGKSLSSKAATISSSEDGFGAQIGIRALVMPALEVNARYQMGEYGDDTDESISSVRAGYSLGAWVMSLSYDRHEEFELEESYGGVRYTFGI